MFSKKTFLSVPVLFLIITILFSITWKSTNAQTVQRIGVFDSRAVAVAFYNSSYSTNKQIFTDLSARMKEAKEKDDKETIALLEREANLRQAFMHEQGFGAGSIMNIIETVKDKIAVLAKEKELISVVSKWELAFTSENAELVDVTEAIAGFFEPDERIKSIIQEIMKSEPVKDAYLIRD